MKSVHIRSELWKCTLRSLNGLVFCSLCAWSSSSHRTRLLDSAWDQAIALRLVLPFHNVSHLLAEEGRKWWWPVRLQSNMYIKTVSEKLVIGRLLSGLSWMSCAVTAAIKLCTESSGLAAGASGEICQSLLVEGGEEWWSTPPTWISHSMSSQTTLRISMIGSAKNTNCLLCC